VINNYDDTDLALVSQAYPDYVREIVWTKEVGEEGTPHIQGWMKLQRQQRLSFVKKLFPRAHWQPLMSDEYELHSRRYAQKLDETAEAGAVHKINDPIKSLEPVIKIVVDRMVEFSLRTGLDIDKKTQRLLHMAEHSLVMEDYRYAKVFVNSTYLRMWKDFGDSMLTCILTNNKKSSHTHTHTDEESSVVIETYPDEIEERSDFEGANEEEDCEDYEEGESEADGDDSTGSGDESCEEDDC